MRRSCAAGGAERVLRSTVLREIRAVVPFDFSVWVLTDPVTTVGVSPMAEIPSLPDLPRIVRWKYLTEADRDLRQGGDNSRRQLIANATG